MFRLFNKLIISVVLSVVISGSLNTLPVFNLYTTNPKNQTTDIKENNIEDITNISENTNKNDATKDEKNISNEIELKKNHQYGNVNKQAIIQSKEEKQNENTSKETTKDSELNDGSNSSNEQKNTDFKLNEENSSVASTDTVLEVKVPKIEYDRTTSIYMNDNLTLLRVEYYLNNKLIYYSVIEQFDIATNSYIEKIYKCNLETNIDPLIRTDVYDNGELKESY